MKTFSKALLSITLLSGSWVVHAVPIQTPLAACDTSDVQIETIQVLDGSAPDILVTPLSATSCLGAFVGNNSDFDLPTQNLGYKDDGWFNVDSYNNWWDTPGAFIEDSELQNLQGLGEVDPGWIYVGKAEGNDMSFQGATMNGTETSYSFIDSLLSFSNCFDADDEATGCGNDAVKGDFSWDPPATNPDALMELLGGQFFDKVGIVFKSANQFAIYEFDLATLGLAPVFEDDFNYAFTGRWDMSETLFTPNGRNPAGLSNVSVWARDPASVTEVPTPATWLLMLTCLVLVLRKRLTL